MHEISSKVFNIRFTKNKHILLENNHDVARKTQKYIFWDFDDVIKFFKHFFIAKFSIPVWNTCTKYHWYNTLPSWLIAFLIFVTFFFANNLRYRKVFKLAQLFFLSKSHGSSFKIEINISKNWLMVYKRYHTF